MNMILHTWWLLQEKQTPGEKIESKQWSDLSLAHIYSKHKAN